MRERNCIGNNKVDQQKQKKSFYKRTAKKNILITGDSILNNIDEKGISTKIANVLVKVRPFSGATIDDMYSYMQPLLLKNPKTIILHIGTNDAPNKTSQDIVNSLLDMR